MAPHTIVVLSSSLPFDPMAQYNIVLSDSFSFVAMAFVVSSLQGVRWDSLRLQNPLQHRIPLLGLSLAFNEIITPYLHCVSSS